MTRWLVDTNLVVDWCLWDLAEKNYQRPATHLSVLRDRVHLRSFEGHLVQAQVLLSAPTFAEAAQRLRRLLEHSHRGEEDRLNEPLLRALVRFLDRFSVRELRCVSEAEVELARRELNGSGEAAFDFGDAALLATSGPETRLITSDKALFKRCATLRPRSAFWFDKGDVHDSLLHVVRPARR